MSPGFFRSARNPVDLFRNYVTIGNRGRDGEQNHIKKEGFSMAETKKPLPWKLLCVSLAVILVFSFLASMFNTGMFTVDVSRTRFDTPNGKLSGLLYMPKGASAESPRPTVIVTHGYLNSAEMQDANAIELSRRGYVVLALDMYDHGHSDINNEVYQGFAAYGDFLMTWAPFWINAMYDAVQYMYGQPYVLKDEAGNGIIGITGHSMGGFSSTIAVARDEADFYANGFRKVCANLTEGSDFSYSGIFGVTAQAFDAAGGGRTLGKVAAQYDEFFFKNPADERTGTVVSKDYVSTPDGMTFLQQTEPAKADTWYDTADGGRRIIYQPAQTHPWNHFSTETTGHAIEFYTAAFAPYAGLEGIRAIDGQIWLWKEICECAALVGFVMFLMAAAVLIARLLGLKAKELKPQESPKGGRLVVTILVLLVAIALPALLFETMYNWTPEKNGVLLWGGIALGALGLIGGIAFAKKDKKALFFGIAAAVGGACLAILSQNSLYADGGVWTAPAVNSVAKWTVGSTFIALLILSVSFVFLKKKDGAKLEEYGISFKPYSIAGGLCVGFYTAALGYLLLFLVDAVFKTDFRIWTFAFKTFDANIAPAIVRYLPTFLAFYIVSSAAICINTNTERLKGWKGYLVAAALNAGGILVWLIRQYVTLFSTGVAAHPTADLSGIVLVAMVPTLAIAGILSRWLYKRTGSIWAPAFLNGLLMTVMTVANTTVYYR